MKVIPKLNLNKHPSACDNGSLIDATNLMISKDNAVLQSEPILDNPHVSNKIKHIFVDKEGNYLNFEIIGIIPCNKELVIFAKTTKEYTIKASIIRYDEELDACYKVTETDIIGDNIIGTFTYNFDNLIIAFSDYSDTFDNMSPLKVINLGDINKFNENDINYNQLKDSRLHPICPEVQIPYINSKHIYGNAYKGWYYIFVRYKISDNTYTQWFNTNECLLIDNFNESSFFKYFISTNQNQGTGKEYNAQNSISDNKDISNLSFKCSVNNIDTKYEYYQLGFVCISKSYSKGYRSNDILTTNKASTFSISTSNDFIFNSNTVVNYDINSIIKSYINYFDVKTLTNNNNRLYISNYKEQNKERNIVKILNEINLEIKFTEQGYINDNDEIYTVIDKNTRIRSYKWQNDPNSFTYFDGSHILVDKTFSEEDPEGGPDREYTALYDLSIGKNEILHVFYIDYSNVSKSIYIKASNIIIAPIENNPNNQGKQGIIYFYDGSRLITECKTITNITYKNGEFIDNDNAVDYDWFPFSNHTINEEVVKVTNDQDTSIDLLNKVCIYPNQPYNFFIHFVDKYGIATQGFNISYFNTNVVETFNLNDNRLETIYNKLGNLIIIPNTKKNINKIICSITLSNIPDEYSGYFVSYEKLEKSVIYSCIANENSNGILNLYSDEFNYADKINLDFDKVLIYKTEEYKPSYDVSNVLNYNCEFVKANNPEPNEEIVVNKEIFVADSYNNIGGSTFIKVKINKDIVYPTSICRLIKNIDDNFYTKENKILIPCTKVIYDTINPVIINTKSGFISTHHACIFKPNTFFNTALKIFQTSKLINTIIDPIKNVRWIDYIEVPMENIQYNNKPDVIFFPDEGLAEVDEKKKSFVIGNIVEAKNSIDLYQQKQVPVYELYPKSLTWYNDKIYYTNNFTKTIRRSNIIQDESNAINWRNFELEQYKNITENKGDIIKLISIGYFFIAHTQHSMFLFNATDTIKATQKDIQLASIDIWDINYKEVLTSDLGFAGIQNEKHGITGEFGYIFYDKDSKRIYRYDNNKLDYIDNDINNLLYKMNSYKSTDFDVTLVDDKLNNRIIFNFINQYRQEEHIVLSYNYKTNTFVSRHTYSFNRAYSTKNNIYFVSNNKNEVFNFDYENFEKATCNIIINTSYPIMKYIDYIQYKVKQVSPKIFNDYSPVEGINTYYSGDRLRVYSEECDTGLLDITVRNPKSNINKVEDYTKPYWQLGNWNFNMLRTKAIDDKGRPIPADKRSRIFGNWFVVNFEFDSLKQIEIETIEAKLK